MNERREYERVELRELEAIMDHLFDAIAASEASAHRSQRVVALGAAHLSYLRPKTWQRAQWDGRTVEGWRIVAVSQLRFVVGMDRHSHPEPNAYIFSASLMLAATPEDPSIRWRELCFWNWADGYSTREQPDAAEFLSRCCGPMPSHGWQYAHGPFAIDGEDEQAFLDRWSSLFAKAAQR